MRRGWEYVITIGLFAAPAAAQEAAGPPTAESLEAPPAEPPQEWRPDGLRAWAGLDVYFSHVSFEGSSSTAFPMVAEVHLAPVDGLVLDAELPWTSGIASGNTAAPDATTAGLGNPSVAARWATSAGLVGWWMGGGIAAPMGLIDDEAWRSALARARRATMGYDPQRWGTGAVVPFITWGVDGRVAPWLSLQVEGKVLPWIGVGDATTPIGSVAGQFGVAAIHEDVDRLLLQNRVGFEARDPDGGFGGGLHLMTVYAPTPGGLSGRGDPAGGPCVQLPTGLSCPVPFPGATTPSPPRADLSLEPHLAYANRWFAARFGVRVELPPFGTNPNGASAGPDVTPRLSFAATLP